MSEPLPERQTMDVDIVCVGFGPATAGFLTTLSNQLVNPDGTPAIESRASRPAIAGDVLRAGRRYRVRGFRSGHAGARHSGQAAGSRPRRRFPWRRRCGRRRSCTCSTRWAPAGGRLPCGSRTPGSTRWGWHQFHAIELPYVPEFLHKHGGLVMSLGQFMQFVGGHLSCHGHGADLAGDAGYAGADR